VNPAERLERAQARAADRLEAIIGTDEWSMFDAGRLALVFSGYDLDGESIAEMSSNIADPYSEAMIHAATEAWRNAQTGGEDAIMSGARFGALTAATLQGAVMVGLLIGLMAAEEEATSENEEGEHHADS
jgi:hypothetical protein